MKLSKVQQEVLDHAKTEIDLARKLDYPDWLKATDHYFQPENRSEALQEAIEKECRKKYWENDRKGIVLTHCSSHTIRALEKRGLIEIIEDSIETGGSIDVVKVLNY